MIEITKAEIVHEPIILKRENDVEKYKQKLIEVADPYPEMFKMDFFDKMGLWLQNGAKYSKVVFIIITLITKIGGKMNEKQVTTNDKKTTNAGIVQLVVGALSGAIALIWGKEIPSEMQILLVSVAVGIYSLAGFFVGLFSNKQDAPKV